MIANPQRHDLSPHRVLLIEASESDAHALRGMLLQGATAPIDVVTVASDREAEEVLASRVVDAVVMDPGSPREPGHDPLARIRKAAAMCPIIVLTGDESRVHELAAAANETQDYLVKWDFDAPLLTRTIHRACARHRTEDDLRRAKEHAEAASRAKSELLASMSHEIRAPLTAILGMTELLADTCLSDEQRRHLQSICSAGAHLRTLVDDILDLSRVEAGRLELERSTFDLHQMIEQTVRFLEVEARAKGLTLASTVAANVPRLVEGDAHRLRQILVNLIANAAKFTDAGRVDVSVTRVGSALAHSVGLRIRVRDTGIGIAADKLGMIFESFRQADSGLARQRGGAGLGLAITRRLVELMGGSIEVDSMPGRGSCFTATLRVARPRACGEAEHACRAPSLRRPSRSLNVLVVDDSADTRLLVEAFLGDAGHVVTSVASGMAALAWLEDRSCDVVLMDMQLPDLSGHETTRRIRQREADTGLAATPIVALTAQALVEDKQRSLAAGCTAHLAKPFQKATLLTAVHDVCGVSACVPGLGEQGRSGPHVVVDADVFVLMPDFLRARQDDLVALRTALDRGELATASTLGHNMKGNGAAYGLPLISELGKRLEGAAAAGDVDNIRGAIDELTAYLASVTITCSGKQLAEAIR